MKEITLLLKGGIILLIIIIVGISLTSCKRKQQDLPNIVIIFMDDLGYSDVSCFGANKYNTTNIDRLANEGARFTNFYASQAVCSASRGSLLTGCYSERIGIQGALNAYSNVGINSDEITIPEMLKEKGYATGIFGKWHLGHFHEFLPLQHGFDEYVGLPYSNDMWPVGFDGIKKESSDYPPLVLYNGNNVIDTISDLIDQAKLTGIYTRNAVQFIEKHKNEPFFLYLPHSMVHVPIAVSEKFKGKSGQGLFADVMMEVDWSVGEILNALEQNGLSKNTLVIFTSDNGPWLNFGNHAGSADPLREGKGNMWEGGPRVSTVMKWPQQIKDGLKVDQIASTIDILSTLSEITGSKLPDNKIDGISFLPLLLENKNGSPRDHFFYYYSGDLIAVRKDNWKLVFPHNYRSYSGIKIGNDGFPGNYSKGVVPKKELYNLNTDIGENQNVIANYPEVVAELEQLADSIRHQLGDNLLNQSGSENRNPGRHAVDKTVVNHKAVDKKINLINEYSSRYSGMGEATLTNGILGSLDYNDGEWLGFQETDFEVLLDLGKVEKIKEITCGFMENQKSWIFLPNDIKISYSTDGNNYMEIAKYKIDSHQQKNGRSVERFSSGTLSAEMQFIRIKASNSGPCPSWHTGAGGKSWLFVDEITVR
jgi:arylsulfatase A-like enzyme